VSKGFGEIVSIMQQRRNMDQMLFRAIIENRDRYNGDVIVPMPDVSSLPAAQRPGPNFFQEAIDGHARSANVTLPKISCPVDNPGSPASIEKSGRRQGALYSAWYDTQLDLKLDRTYRHLAAYGTMAMIVSPDDKRQRATIEIRDPLTAYPELRAPDDIRTPSDCGFLYARSPQWIAANYPQAPDYLKKSDARGWDTLWDMVEWIDEDDIVIGVMGPRVPAYGYSDARPYGQSATELGRWKNKAGMTTVVVPRRATLDRIMGQMTSMINYSDLFARMLSLQLVATEKATFPDMVVMSRTGTMPQLIGGKWQDGRSGNVNVVLDGVVEAVGKEPGPGTMPMLQLVDAHIRGTGGASPLYGGNAGGARSGAQVDAIGDYSVNPMVAESQRVMQRSLVEINKQWMSVMKGYYGEKTFTCILGLPGSAKTVTFTPDKDFTSLENVVAYSSPGTDPNKLAVALTQLAATNIISRRTARVGHPLVQDEEEEEQFVSIEKMTDATIAGFTNEIAQGQQTSAVGARATELVAKGTPAYLAIGQAIAEAAAGPGAGTAPDGGAPTGPDGQPMSPGLASLMASQGGGLTPKGLVPANAPPGSTVPGPNPDLMNFRHVLQGLNEQASPGAT
jgi:hypothetical protein